MEEVVDAIDHVSGMAPANMAANEEEAVKDYLSTSASSIHIAVHLSIFSRCVTQLIVRVPRFVLMRTAWKAFVPTKHQKKIV